MTATVSNDLIETIISIVFEALCFGVRRIMMAMMISMTLLIFHLSEGEAELEAEDVVGER